MELFYKNGTSEIVNSLAVDIEKSKKVFQRTGEIVKIKVSINKGLVA